MKKHIVLLLSVAAVLLLSGCSPSYYEFQGKTYEERVLEEKLADMIEVDNPQLDVEVNISQESDD